MHLIIIFVNLVWHYKHYSENKLINFINRIALILLAMIFLASNFLYCEDGIIIHSDMTFEEAIKSTKAPKDIINSLELVNVEYYNFEGELCRGQILLHKELADDIKEVFALIKKDRFPVHKCEPIVAYGWSDNAAMSANVTSAFNYRFVAGTKRLSNHATGRAIDINPFTNPVIYSDGKISPKGATYDSKARGTISAESPITKLLKQRGWQWGGDWNSLKDYQHFDKK